MMPRSFNLQDVRVAILAADGVEQSEIDYPRAELERAGARVEVLGASAEAMRTGIQSMNQLRVGKMIMPDRILVNADPHEYQALLIPGGAWSADRMRESILHLGFLKGIVALDRPVGVLSHGAWLLADSGIAQGKTLTSWPAIRKDLERAGAIWKDQPAIEDELLVTGRRTADLPRFSELFLARVESAFRGQPVRAA